MHYETWTKQKLIERIFDLEAAVSSLETAIGLDRTILLADAFGLTKTEAAIVAVLSSGRAITKEHIAEAVFADRSSAPETTVKAALSKVRSKLSAFDIELKTIHGVGVKLIRNEIIDAVLRGDVKNIRMPKTELQGEFSPKWKAVLRLVMEKRNEHGVSTVSTSEVKQATGVSGNVAIIIQKIARRAGMRILKRPTVSSPRQKWVIASKEVVCG